MYKALQPFDIISSPYVSLDGTIKKFPNGDPQRALFMVINVDYDNLLCAKITSQNNQAYLSNSVLLTKQANYFLMTDSYVQLDKLHTLSTANVNYIGYADKPSRYAMYKVLSAHFAVISQDLKRFCNPPRNNYVSPNSYYK